MASTILEPLALAAMLIQDLIDLTVGPNRPASCDPSCDRFCVSSASRLFRAVHRQFDNSVASIRPAASAKHWVHDRGGGKFPTAFASPFHDEPQIAVIVMDPGVQMIPPPLDMSRESVSMALQSVDSPFLTPAKIDRAGGPVESIPPTTSMFFKPPTKLMISIVRNVFVPHVVLNVDVTSHPHESRLSRT